MVEIKVEVKPEDLKQEEPKEILTPEEQQSLKDQPAPEGYAKAPSEIPEEEPKDEEAAEEKPAETKEPTEKKTEDKEAAETKEVKDDKKPDKEEPEDSLLKLERELQKPEGQEDLVEFNEREKAYFFQMRRDRKSRQKAEEDRDAALFREIQSKKEKEKKEEEVDPLEGKDPTDFMTVGEVKDLMKKQKAEKPAPDDQPAVDPMQVRVLQLFDKECRESHPEDYDAVMELVPDLINTNSQHVQKVAAAMHAGKNPAEEAYQIIKGDPEFAKLFPVARTKWLAKQGKDAKKPEEKEKSPEAVKKEEEAKKAEEALEKPKVKTTGHISAGAGTPAGEMTIEQIAAMSDQEFAQLPKKTRDHYLKEYGA